MGPHAKHDDTSVHQGKECRMMAAHIASSQLYSMGHKRRPVSSCSKPRSSLDVGGRGADRGAPSMLVIQLTTAGFKLAASSPLAPPDPFLSYLKNEYIFCAEWDGDSHHENSCLVPEHPDQLVSPLDLGCAAQGVRNLDTDAPACSPLVNHTDCWVENIYSGVG
jgi:hypothetical protein